MDLLRPAGLATILFSTLLALAAVPVQAQLSPVCERNGRRDYCALTPVAASTNARQVSDLIMFADNTVVQVFRNLESCKKISEMVETCNARITRRTGGSQSIPATYRATFFEGGVKHEYISKGLRITYHVAD